MTAEQVSKDQVSLEDLKRAIEAVPVRPPGYLTELLLVYLDMRGRAWRTAFEWRNAWIQQYWDAEDKDAQVILEVDEAVGMRLIREKLT